MMIKAGYLSLFLLLLLNPSSILAWSGKVIGVADGDTIKVLHNNKPVRIRLYGIDTPEKRQAFGNKAKKYTNAMVRGKTVAIDPVTKDRYGRTVAMVHINRKNLNESLVQQGFAWVYRKYCKMSICDNWYQYEDQARTLKKGLWRDPHAIPPWQWRKEKRQKHNRSKP
jgi:endonuclease YncB( thermonuclease family)